MSGNDNQGAGTGMRLWLRVLLFSSLALNLLIVGLVAGAFFRIGKDGGGPPYSPALGAVMFRELPDADRDHLRRGFDPSKRDGHRQQRRADAEALASALRASPFDLEAVRDVLAGQAARRAALQQGMQDAWLERIAAMTDDERLSYADRVEKGARRDRKKH